MPTTPAPAESRTNPLASIAEGFLSAQTKGMQREIQQREQREDFAFQSQAQREEEERNFGMKLKLDEIAQQRLLEREERQYDTSLRRAEELSNRSIQVERSAEIEDGAQRHLHYNIGKVVKDIESRGGGDGYDKGDVATLNHDKLLATQTLHKSQLYRMPAYRPPLDELLARMERGELTPMDALQMADMVYGTAPKATSLTTSRPLSMAQKLAAAQEHMLLMEAAGTPVTLEQAVASVNQMEQMFSGEGVAQAVEPTQERPWGDKQPLDPAKYTTPASHMEAFEYAFGHPPISAEEVRTWAVWAGLIPAGVTGDGGSLSRWTPSPVADAWGVDVVTGRAP